MKIQELLTDVRFAELRLIGGASGIDHAISTVTVIDTPDGAQWLTGGELVITTAFMLKDDEDALLQFIGYLNVKKVSGLCIKQGRYIQEIPSSAISLANSLQMPLLLIPAKYSFADIINPILSDLVNQQANRLIQASIIHDKFTELAISDATIPDILSAFMLIVGVPVAFLDLETNLIWNSDDNCELARSLQSLNPQFYKEGDLDGYEICNIANQNRKFGYLIFEEGVLERHKDSGFQTALENMTTNIILREQTLISNRQVAERYKNSLVQDLLTHNIKSENEIHNRAEIFGWNFHDGGMVLIVDINNFKQKFTEHISSNTNKMLEEMTSEIFQISIEEITAIYKNARYLKRHDLIAFIISVPTGERGSIEKNIEESFAKIRERIKNIPFTISIAAGGYCDNIVDIHLSYSQAKSAIAISYTFNWFDRTLFYEKLSLFRVLLPVFESPEAVECCMNCLQPLIRYDAESGKNMLETLLQVAESDWNIKLAAERMYLHPNSVKYRLEHISELIQMNLKDRSDRLLIEIALLAYTINKDTSRK